MSYLESCCGRRPLIINCLVVDKMSDRENLNEEGYNLELLEFFWVQWRFNFFLITYCSVRIQESGTVTFSAGIRIRFGLPRMSISTTDMLSVCENVSPKNTTALRGLQCALFESELSNAPFHRIPRPASDFQAKCVEAEAVGRHDCVDRNLCLEGQRVSVSVLKCWAGCQVSWEIWSENNKGRVLL